MQVDFATIADYAAIDSTGKLTVVGVFDEIYAQQFPVVWPVMVLLLRLRIKRVELGLKQQMLIKLSDADGKVLFQIEGEFTPESAAPSPHRPDGTVNQIIRITNTQFPEAGAYSIDVFVNNTAVAAVPIYVLERAKPS